MLKTNIKLWAIVIVICLVGQFFIASVPIWIEQGKQEAQIEINKREEERLQSHEPGLEPVETQIVEPNITTQEMETETEPVSSESSEEKLSFPPALLIVLGIIILALVFVLFI